MLMTVRGGGVDGEVGIRRVRTTIGTAVATPSTISFFLKGIAVLGEGGGVVHWKRAARKRGERNAVRED